ncbi:multidrug MFS transporter [Lactococcus fujiensis JCM 16395]|uniref:Multidrug MFS transporter n=2 Tax=Lactococcus fujiensis TaxID=610251 RepID=A0A2A5RNG5_9LACT|nr:multidrug MFS transporter [Lactococcus fujiensis JCM 16395]
MASNQNHAMDIEKDYSIDIHGNKYSRWAMLILILIGTFGSMLMQTSLGTAIPTLMKDFDITMSTAQQATTWFLLANGIMVPISAYLATKFPTRWLYSTSYIILFAGMFIAYAAPTSSWGVFLAGRMLQAVAAGLTMPLMQVCLVNMFPPKQMGAVMGLGGIVIGLGPAIGPTFSGWLMSSSHNFLGIVLPASWRTMFLVPMVIVAIVTVLSFFLMRDVIPNRPVKLDLISLVESVIGFGVFLWGFTNVSSDGWTKFSTVILPIIVGIVFITAFILRQLNLKEPFLDVRVFKNKQFTLTTLILALATMAMMGVEMMLPLYLQQVHALSAFDSGLVLMPGALMMGIISPLAGIAFDKVGAKRLSILGFSILAVGTIPFLFFNTATPDHFVTTLYGLRMFGIAMVMMPLTASAMNALPVDEVAHGTASNSTARSLASAVVVALLSSVTQNVITNNLPSTSLKTTNPLDYAGKAIDGMLKGYHTSFAIGLGFAVVGFIVAFFLSNTKGAGSKAKKEIEQGGTK